MFCQYCGTKLEDNASECPNCHSAVTAASARQNNDGSISKGETVADVNAQIKNDATNSQANSTGAAQASNGGQTVNQNNANQWEQQQAQWQQQPNAQWQQQQWQQQQQNAQWQQQQWQQQQQQRQQEDDSGSAGFGVLGFFVPIVGLILYLIWQKDYPKRAKAAGIGALVAVCVGVFIGVLFGIIISISMTTIYTNPSIWASLTTALVL